MIYTNSLEIEEKNKLTSNNFEDKSKYIICFDFVYFCNNIIFIYKYNIR